MTTSMSPSLSRSAKAIPCEMPDWSKPHSADESLKVPSRLFLKATLGVRRSGNNAIRFNMLFCDKVVLCFSTSTFAAMSAFWKSRNWPLVTKISS